MLESCTQFDDIGLVRDWSYFQINMVMLEYDRNYVLVEPMRNRTTAEILHVHQHLINRLNKRGLFPMHQVLDNEVSV